ncbi:SLAC1-like protein 3 [Perilla frutescens var. hirtella]|uniref:SLAC1-like protein 3 n=1 Tax=Perilla frutescens var. hirtella TaxID=608512 RepID=A0AAD4P5Z1_PERFH|nr:SLAC1-like protein 3 [Perilla frutescens var. hirtella]
MEKMEEIERRSDDLPEGLPSLIKAITQHDVAGFDSENVQEVGSSNPSVFGIEEGGSDEDVREGWMMHSVSISMPGSPVAVGVDEKYNHTHKTKRVVFNDDNTLMMGKGSSTSTFYSQPIPKGIGNSLLHDTPSIANKQLRDKRFDSFKTWSGGLERQLSNLRGRTSSDDDDEHPQMGSVPVQRFFDALEGPELDVLRPSEQIVLPEDKQWPFLLRFPIASFGICLGVSSQAIMWKTLASTQSTQFLHISPHINQLAWFTSIALILIVSSIYSLKLIFYLEAVRREYHHPIRVNFFFAPWISLLFLALGIPPSICKTLTQLPKPLWYILMSPIFLLELKIYGQWMSGGQRRLSKVANPSNHLSVVGNFVGALLGASMGLKEGPIFFFAIGLAHYVVLFVTLYQRLPTNETLPKDLHPVFFLFVAAPSVASMAWANIVGSFDYGSRMAYFVAMFLYFSLAIRVNFFRGVRFSLAWWAYTFPMTGAAIATIRYSSAVNDALTKTFAVALCIVATLTVAALLVTTMIHAFILGDLFPNDIAIAISERRPKSSTRKWFHRRSGSSDNNIHQYLKYSDAKDVEASLTHHPSK